MQLDIGMKWHIWIIIYVNKDRYLDMQSMYGKTRFIYIYIYIYIYDVATN